MTTKYKIAEQVLFKLYGGAIDISNPVQPQDVIEAVNQEVNVLLKTQHFSVTLPAGDTIPENLMIATYNDVAVTSFGGKKAKALLPAMPIALPRNMGVFEVSDDEYFSNLFIPLLAGQANLVSSQPMISTLLGQTGYEVYGNAIDQTAEYIRTLGNYTPGSITRFAELSQIPDQTKIPRAELMIMELAKDNEQLLNMWKDAFPIAEQENEQGVANFIAERIDAHGKWAWQLKSILKKERA